MFFFRYAPSLPQLFVAWILSAVLMGHVNGSLIPLLAQQPTAAVDTLEVQDGAPTQFRPCEPRQLRLTLHRTLGESAFLGDVSDMVAVGGFLLVGDGMGEPHLHLVDLSDGSVVRQFASSGQGPGEFGFPRSMERLSSDPPRVRIFDPQNQRLSWYEFIGPSLEPDLVRELPLHTNALIQEVSRTRDRLIASGLFGAEYSLLELDTLAQLRARVWTPPAIGPNEVQSPAFLRHLNANQLVVRPSGGKAALLYQEANHIVVIDFENRTYRALAGPRDTKVRFEAPRGRYGFIRGEHEMAYVRAAATDRYIYGLFCACAFDPEINARPLPRRVHVFDWNGRFIFELVLDRRVVSIAVAPEDSLLWGYMEEPVPLIGEWRLPSDLHRCVSAVD